MSKPDYKDLSRRERQIMDVVFRHKRANALDIQEGMPEAPSYSAVRAMLRILVEKGYLRATREGAKLVYTATEDRAKVRRSVLRNVVQTFFDGSTGAAVSALLDLSAGELTEEEAARLRAMIDEARRENR